MVGCEEIVHDRPHLVILPRPKHRSHAGALVADQVEVGVPLVPSSVLDDGQGAQGTPAGVQSWQALSFRLVHNCAGVGVTTAHRVGDPTCVDEHDDCCDGEVGDYEPHPDFDIYFSGLEIPKPRP